MLIKEYRIPLPLTVEEYRIAQLYMIAVSFRNKKLEFLCKHAKLYFNRIYAVESYCD